MTAFGAVEVSALVWLLGAVLASFLGHVILKPVGHRPRLLYCSLAHVLKEHTFCRWAPPLHWVCVVLLLAPPFLLARSAMIAADEHWRVVALGCPVAVALYAGSFGVVRLRADSFRWSRMALVGLGASALCLVVFFVLFICFIDPFSFIGTSISMLCLSAAPSIALAFTLLPWCNTDAVLARLQSGDSPAAVGKRWKVVSCCLAASLGTLVAYAVLVLQLHPDSSVVYVGFVVAAGVAVLDLIVWHLWRLGHVAGPLQSSLLMLAARVAACIWGEHYWLLGHSGVFVAAGVLLSHITLNCWLQNPDSAELRRQAKAEQVLALLERGLTKDAPTDADDKGDDKEELRPTAKAVACREHPGWLLLVLILAFSLEVGITWIPAVSPALHANTIAVCGTCAVRPQNYYGVASMLAVLVYALSLLVLRKAQWLAVQRKGPLLAVAWRTLLPTYGCWLGLAAFVSFITDVWAVLVHAGFLPSVLGLFYAAYTNWVADDFKLPRVKGHSPVAPVVGDQAAAGDGAQDPPVMPVAADQPADQAEPGAKSNCLMGCWRAVPWSVWVWAADVVLLLAYVATLQQTLLEGSRWIAWTTGVGLGTVGLSFLSNRAWFGTLKFNVWQWGAWLAIVFTLLVWALAVWQTKGQGKIDYFALSLLLVVLMYPALYSTELAFGMWWDAGWVLKDDFTRKFVYCAFGLSGAIYVAFLAVLVALGFQAEAVCGACLAGLAAAFGVAVWRWRRGGGFLSERHRRCIGVVFAALVLLGAVVLAVVYESFFGGFTAACTGAALIFATKAWFERSEVSKRPPLQQLKVPADIFFPAFRTGSTGELVSGHREVVAVLLFLCTTALWGLVAAAALPDFPYVGAVVAALALTASFVLVCSLVSQGGSDRMALCSLPAASLAKPVAEALATEGPATAAKVGSDSTAPTEGADGSSADPVLSKEEDEEQRRLLQKSLQELVDNLAAARQACEDAVKEACVGRFHPLPLISLLQCMSALVARCRGGAGCMADTSPSQPHVSYTALACRAADVLEAVQQRQRFLARLQLCLLAAEAQRRWSREAEFRAFLESFGGGAAGSLLSAQDLKRLPQSERERLEAAWERWNETEAERRRLDELRRQQEEEAARKRREAQRKAREDAHKALAEAVAAGDAEALRAALNRSSAVLLDSDPAVVSAKQALEVLQQLEQALAADDADALEQALVRAKLHGLNVEHARARLEELRGAEEDERARKERQRAEAQRELQRAMGAGRVDELEAALEVAKTLGLDLDEAQDRCQQLVDARQALRDALGTGELAELQAALAHARGLGLAADEVGEAHQLVEQLEEEAEQTEERKRRKEELREAMAGGSISALEEAIANATEVGVSSTGAEERLQRLKGVRDALEQGVAQRQAGKLERMLGAASAAGLEDPVVSQAIELLSELRAEEARRRREEDDARRRREEEARRKQMEEEIRRKKEEEDRRKREEEEKRKGGAVPVQKLDVEALLSTVPEGGRYTDPDFTPSNALIKKAYQWQRLPEFLRNPQLIEKGMIPDDIGQGELGDCWFLSAMACCAATPQLLEPVFVYTDVQKGLYVVRLYHLGAFRDVAVDDMFPTKYGGPSFAKSKTCKDEVWVSVLEKAYAKLHGSYDAIEGGHVSEGLVDLTGGIGDAMSLRTNAAKQSIHDGSFWAKMKGLSEDGHLLGCGSHAGKDTDTSPQGIVQGHAYSILRVEEVDGNRLVQLRNPWGDTEWSGKWGDCDKASWTQRMQAKLNYKDRDDGTFWMAFEDFVMHYSTVYVCRILGDGWQRQLVSSSWRGEAAGGCSNYATWQNNPVFRLSLNKRVRLLLVLEQRLDRDAESGLFCIAVSLYRADRNGGRGGSFASSGSYINRRHVCLEAEVEPGAAGPHFAIASTFDPGEECDFGLGVYWHGEADDVSLYPA